MTNEPAYAGDDPRRLLSSSRDLAHRVRQAQRATWFPLLVLTAATFAAIPVERYSHYASTCRAVLSAGHPAGRVCAVYSTAALVYWPIALVLAYIVIALFYIRRSRALGLGTRVRPYVIAGIVIAVAFACGVLWTVHNLPVGAGGILRVHGAVVPRILLRLVSPFCAIGAALLVLARAERSRALLSFALAYLAIALVPVNFGWVMTMPSPWFFIPHLIIDGGVLLLGGIGFALAQRPARPVVR